MSENSNGHMGTALVYCRVSTRKQEDDGTSLDTQEEACREHAKAAGYTVAGTYRETYTGAEIFDRPALNRLRDEVRAGQHGAVIVYAIDRLTRAQGLTGYLLYELERAGCELLSVTDPLEATPQGKLLVSVKEFVAEIEREKIRERTVRGKLGILQAGRVHNSGTDLYGYRRDKERGVRTVCEPEAEIVREVFHAVAVDGLSVRAVYRRLNERGVPPPTAGKRTYDGHYQSTTPAWGLTTLKRMIHEPAYKGDTVLWRYKTDPATKKIGLRPVEEQIRLPDGTTPAIVSPEIWQTAQERVATNRSTHTRNEKRPYLLRGLILCAVCGQAMCPDTEHGRRIYRCSSRSKPGGRCEARRVPAEDLVDRDDLHRIRPRDEAGNFLPLDDETLATAKRVPGVESWAWERVASILRDPSLVASELARRQAEGPDPAITQDLESAHGQLARIEKQQRKLVERFGEAEGEDFPWELVSEQIRRLEQQKEQLASMVRDRERALAEQQLVSDQLEQLSAYCDRVGQNLESFGFAQRRLALEALGVRVYARGREWRIEGRIPLESEACITDTTFSSLVRRAVEKPSWLERSPPSCPR